MFTAFQEMFYTGEKDVIGGEGWRMGEGFLGENEKAHKKDFLFCEI